MTNQRNVDALERLLLAAEAGGPGGRPAKLVHPVSAVMLARWLAAQGVLVPSAVDDDTLADVIGLSDDGRGFSFPWVLRDCLEHLAKGEPLPPVGYHHPSPEEIREIAERINHPAAEPLSRQ